MLIENLGLVSALPEGSLVEPRPAYTMGLNLSHGAGLWLPDVTPVWRWAEQIASGGSLHLLETLDKAFRESAI